MVSVSSEGEADVVSVTATSPDPAQAKRVANTFARQFISFRAGTDRSKLLQAKRLAEKELARLSPAEAEGARGQALSRGAEKLGILASLQTGNAELVQPADLPTSPSSPKPVRNGILGGSSACCRNPSLARQHGLRVGPGLAELLTHQIELDEAIQAKPISVGGNGKGGGERTLDVIVAGASPPNPAELIESQRMSEVLAKLGERYELVVIDTAPVGVVWRLLPAGGGAGGRRGGQRGLGLKRGRVGEG